jgi:hypothetical protein
MNLFFFFCIYDKKKNFWSLDYLPQVPDYQNFRISGYHIKGLLLYKCY